ncbi:MAG: ABC transporter substrate-binding protein [Rhodopila sp.]|nr:ABC transporter substrate-binding protein [Rhodopila sp.]
MNTSGVITRRMALGAAAATVLARPSLIRAQAASAPVRIGLLSDVAGPYRNVNGPGAKIAVDLAVEDFGGSLLGRPIEVVQADIQNKPDISSAKAREWIDSGFNVLVDGGATSSGLAVQEVARAKKTIYLGNGPSATDLTGKFCSPYGFHFWADTYSLAKGTGGTLTKAGGNTWFFITADYQFGYSLQANTEHFIKAAGGQILGDVKVPLGTTDFSSALLQARASGAKVVGFANAGADLQNCIKQAAEFGIVRGGQSLATLVMFVTDVVALGQDVCEGLVLTNSFYWDLTPKTRAWTERFVKRMGLPPTMAQAADYSAALHWMRAAQAANSIEADAVAAKMRAMPVSDFYHDNVPVRSNGQVLDPMYVWRVKPSARATHKWDFYEPIGTIEGKDAFMPLDETGCALTRS